MQGITWREYHEATKHSAESLRRSSHVLDWENMPYPFRHYEGAPVVDLPADPPAPELPATDLLQGKPGSFAPADGTSLLSCLLYYSAAISASKRVPSTGYKYALRVNPSSGNLHPTEFHYATNGLDQWEDGLYHYRPSSHMAEQRALGGFTSQLAAEPASIVFVLTSIASREAWKYRERAYRYCLHDMGHAWQALALSAGAMGYTSFAVGHFADDELAQGLQLSGDEWPMLIVALRGPSEPAGKSSVGRPIWSAGRPNKLASQLVSYPLLDQIHAATKLESAEPGIAAPAGIATGNGEVSLPRPASSARSFGQVARTRRSALDFRGGDLSMSLSQLSAVLDCATRPLSADFAGSGPIQLYLYAHRIQGLEPGVYRHWWQRRELERIRTGDQRVAAAGLSLGQNLAGNACVAFSMIAELDRVTSLHGDRGYRYAHFEAGAIGHRMYLAAEAFGLAATGIGAFYDDQVHRYLNLDTERQQVIYHFAIGYGVPDPRLQA
jgi:SagB-type dehydrogenase family enzyme